MEINNDKCYWLRFVRKSEHLLEACCVFNPEELVLCNSTQLCLNYIHEDKVDDFIRHLLKEIEILQGLP